jgi:hypothetical protein
LDKEFEVFKKPPLKSKTWRYMDFTKFVSTLSENALYFRRMDLLDDAFEGSLPKAFRSKKSVKTKSFLKKIYPENHDEHFKNLRNAEKTIDHFSSKLNKAKRKFVFINSWHMNEDESAAMWRLYLKSTEGVAFQSTFQRLSDSFIQKEDIGFGLIKYVDNYNKDTKDFSDINFYLRSFPYMFKRKCFEHEKELRAIILTAPETEQAKQQFFSKFGIKGMPEGLPKEVDLYTLIEKIYVSPTAEKWFEKLVRSVVEKYGFNIEVTKSSLADKPTF